MPEHDDVVSLVFRTESRCCVFSNCIQHFLSKSPVPKKGVQFVILLLF